MSVVLSDCLRVDSLGERTAVLRADRMAGLLVAQWAGESADPSVVPWAGE